MIKIILLTSNTVLISEIEEVGADIGEPDCKLINPYVINQSSLSMEPWLLNITTQSEFMISSDKILTCLLYTSPSPRDAHESRMPSSA